MALKPRSRFLISAFSLVSLLALLLSACGPTGTPTTSNNGKATKGGVWLDDLINEPDSFIPNASVQTFADMVDQTIYTPLFAGNPDGSVSPGLVAELPTTANGGISSDLKTWKFRLRPGLKWSDGQPLNADDVDFSWKLWANKAFPAQSTVGIRLIQSADVASDKLSITFHLSTPYAPFISTWTDGELAPLPKHHFESAAPDQIKKSSDNLFPTVSSGPFVMTESKPGDHYTVSRNTNYYRASEGLPYLDKIIFRVVTSSSTILKDLQAGSIDSAWFLDVSKIDSYKKLDQYQIVTGTSASYEGIHVDLNNPILKDVKVRQAISIAVDRDNLVKVARHNLANANCTDHSKVYNPGYQPDVACPKFDIAAANTLLDQAGWKMGSDNVRQKGGQRLEFQYSTTANNLWRQEDEVLIQASLKKIGIKLDVNNYPASTFFGPFLRSGQSGKYDLAEYASSYTYDANDSSALSCSQIPPHGSNYSFYCNQQLDQLFDKELTTADPQARQQIFNQIHQVILTDYPIIPLYNLIDLEIAKKGTHNYQLGPFGASETVNAWSWWCDNGKCPA